jgi:hypothetical protein
MGPTEIMNRGELIGAYDRAADVLYLSLRSKTKPLIGEDHERGLVLRFSADDDTPAGVTVIGFKRNGWPSLIDTLSARVASHLSVEPGTVRMAIAHAVDPRSPTGWIRR